MLRGWIADFSRFRRMVPGIAVQIEKRVDQGKLEWCWIEGSRSGRACQ